MQKLLCNCCIKYMSIKHFLPYRRAFWEGPQQQQHQLPWECSPPNQLSLIKPFFLIPLNICCCCCNCGNHTIYSLKSTRRTFRISCSRKTKKQLNKENSPASNDRRLRWWEFYTPRINLLWSEAKTHPQNVRVSSRVSSM